MNKTNNPRLTMLSKALRKGMTNEERHLWYDFLKGLPVTFHRQKVIGKYIVDFYCAKAKIIIELDGSQHYQQKGLRCDEKRDAYMQRLGLVVKRYTNADIRYRFHDVCEDIHACIYSMPATSSGAVRHLPLKGKA